MQVVYPKLLKKLTIQKIKKIRQLYKMGWSEKRIAERFEISRTTVDWHVGSLKRVEYVDIT